MLVTMPKDCAIALTPNGAGVLPSKRRMAIDRLTAGTGRTRVVLAATADVLLAVWWILAVNVLIKVFVLVQTMDVFDNSI
ncbi:MAG TPA: hypothetical protein VNA44_10930 [Burkholderiaceae bacterium]|nr:hypothetical protein [Burkholderiaceae bacterium]